MIPEEVAEKLGFVLGTTHELAENILLRLSYRDLISAIQVCRTWNKIGRNILNKERKLRFMTSHPPNLCHSKTVSKRHHKIPNIESLDHFLTRLTSHRAVCLGFLNEELTVLGSKASHLYTLLKEVLPAKSQLSIVSASGIVGTVQKLNTDAFSTTNSNSTASSSNLRGDDSLSFDQDNLGYSIEMEEADCSTGDNGYCLVAIPDQPGVKITVINLDEEDFFKKYRSDGCVRQKLVITNDEFNSICQLDPKDHLKALLIFYGDSLPGAPLTRAFENAAMIRHNNKLAMGGGLIRGLQDKDTNVHENATAIAFSGKNVTAASIIVPKTVVSPQQLRKLLEKFSDFYIPGSQSMCFMFACCGRGQLWYMVKNNAPSGTCSKSSFHCVECKAFRELFPKVPIFGFFGEGELGVEYMPSESLEPDPCKKRKKYWHHQFTTIFVMVSIL